ncbi:uncharacterized protein CEXT_102431 [Caerostris extrusa]|uniref:Uncharacterized protein n=1 Tax=Caerostris extrusa TaxID=172846 RepID=A0AAV4N373_CAEEX|nr:uncharacterized protein CEXT_102431 [Caerostris extrusa]
MYCFIFAASFPDKESPERQIKQNSIEIFKALEDTFSFIIFAVFTIFLFSFFQVDILIFLHAEKQWYCGHLHLRTELASHLVLVVVVVLSADNVQQKMNHLYYKFSNDSDLDAALNPHYLNVLENHDTWTLTGWRMFAVRKPLLLSLSAWLFTYGVIIIQFFYSPQN